MIDTVSPLDLALVVPVWNDADGLARLLTQARRLGVFGQIVVVDDGSDVQVIAPDITRIRHASPQGAGPARNAGLEAVTTSYVLFFDADDALTDELGFLCADLAEADPFDLCLFAHADSRVLAEARWGQTDWDQGFWEEAGCGGRALQEARDLPVLAQTTNYPWNKIWRTAFLRDNGIGCAQTKLHEDMALHWHGLIAAKRALVSDRICALHHVAQRGGRQTNLMGAERLEVFAAFDPVVEVVTQAGPVWQAALARYALVLIDWIAARIDPAHLPALRQAEQAWLHATVLPWLENIREIDPNTDQKVQDRAS